MRRRRKRSPALLYVFLFLALVVALAVGFLVLRYMPTGKHMNLYDYFEVSKGEDPLIILGEKRLQERGLFVDGRAYLPMTLVYDYLNPTFYWNQDTQEVYYCQPSGIEKTPVGSEVYLSGEKLYLSAELVKRHTDMDVYVHKDPDRIVLRTGFEKLQCSTTLRKVRVRYRGGIKSEVLSEVEKGQTVIVLKDEEGWKKVSTWDGYIGYVESKYLSYPQETTFARDFSQETYTFLQEPSPVNMVFAAVYTTVGNEEILGQMSDMYGVNVVAPTWFALTDNEGNYTDFSSADFVDVMHQRGIKVWGVLDNLSGDVSTYQTMQHSSIREKLIQSLLRSCEEVGMDGINLDFEYLTEDSAPHFNEFVRELAIETHRRGITLSFDGPPPEGYTGHYRRDAQATALDYCVIMGYDEHYAGSETAGSVASYPWVRQGVEDTIAQFPAKRCILALPFYTRKWWTQGGENHSEVVFMFQQEELIRSTQAQSYWDTEVMQNVATWEEEGRTYQMWMEDDRSIAVKAGLVRDYQLGGLSCWRLGYENNSIWQVLVDALS